MSPLRRQVAIGDAAHPSRRVLFVALAVAGVLVAVLAFAAAPLEAAIARSEADVARSRLVLAISRERLADNASLSRESPAPRAADLRTAVERVLVQHALRSAPVTTGTADNRYSIVIANGRFDALVAALEMLARDEGIRLVEGTLTARVEPGAVRAELTLGR